MSQSGKLLESLLYLFPHASIPIPARNLISQPVTALRSMCENASYFVIFRTKLQRDPPSPSSQSTQNSNPTLSDFRAKGDHKASHLSTTQRRPQHTHPKATLLLSQPLIPKIEAQSPMLQPSYHSKPTPQGPADAPMHKKRELLQPWRLFFYKQSMKMCQVPWNPRTYTPPT
jgi:hypothetical protein